MKNERGDQKSSDDSQDNKLDPAAENPYATPITTHSDAQTPPKLPASPGGWAAVLKVLGFSVAALLLVIVVGFGLLVGCCAMGVR